VKKIASGEYHSGYTLDRERGEYRPADFEVDFSDYFEF